MRAFCFNFARLPATRLSHLPAHRRSVTRHAEIRAVLEMFVPPASKVEFEILAVASRGEVVFTERVDRFTVGGKEIALPVAGVFEVRDGKIAAWRDYFDMASYQRQLG